MVQLIAVDDQNQCRFYRVKLLQHTISRFTMISMVEPEFFFGNFG